MLELSKEGIQNRSACVREMRSMLMVNPIRGASVNLKMGSLQHEVWKKLNAHFIVWTKKEEEKKPIHFQKKYTLKYPRRILRIKHLLRVKLSFQKTNHVLKISVHYRRAFVYTCSSLKTIYSLFYLPIKKYVRTADSRYLTGIQ